MTNFILVKTKYNEEVAINTDTILRMDGVYFKYGTQRIYGTAIAVREPDGIHVVKAVESIDRLYRLANQNIIFASLSTEDGNPFRIANDGWPFNIKVR